MKINFNDIFPNEDSCVSFVINEIYNGNKPCPKCGCKKIYLLKSGYFKCSQDFCKSRFRLSTGTAFNGSTLPFITVFYMVSILIEKNVSSVELGYLSGIIQAHAYKWKKKILFFIDQNKIKSDERGMLFNTIRLMFFYEKKYIYKKIEDRECLYYNCKKHFSPENKSCCYCSKECKLRNNILSDSIIIRRIKGLKKSPFKNYVIDKNIIDIYRSGYLIKQINKISNG